MEQLFQLNIQTPTKVITMQTTNPDDVIKMMQLSGQPVVSHEIVAIDSASEVCPDCGMEPCECEGCSICGQEQCECDQHVDEEYENTPDATREREPRVHGDITDFGAPGQGHSKHGYRGTAASGDNPLTFESLTQDYATFKKKVSEGNDWGGPLYDPDLLKGKKKPKLSDVKVKFPPKKPAPKQQGVEEGRMVKGPGGVPLDRQGNPKVARPALPKPSRMVEPEPEVDLGKIWFDTTQIIGNIFPDGDPADYFPRYCRKHGCTYDDIRAAFKKHGYKDEYDYINDMKSGDYGYNEQGVAEATGDAQFDSIMGKISLPAMKQAQQQRKLSAIQSIADALCNDQKCDYDDLTDQDLEFIAGEAGTSIYDVMSALGRQKFNPKRNIGKLDLDEQGVAEGSIKDIEGKIRRHDQRKADREQAGDPYVAHELHSHNVIRKQLLDKRKRAQSAYQKKIDAELEEGVAESSGSALERILAAHPEAVENFKQGGDLDYDLESDLWDYYFNKGEIRNYDADAGEFISQRLADELGLSEGRLPQLPTRGADYSGYDTEHLKAMLKPGIMHRDELKFKALIRRELKKREAEAQQKGTSEQQ